MQWNAIKRAGRITVDGRDYDLQHLQDSEFSFAIPATSGYPEINASILIQYGSHCVTRGPRHRERFDFAALGHDRLIVDEKRNERCFSTDRYQWSMNLPAIIESLPSGRPCFFTNRENWLSIEILDSLGRPQVYEVYFNLTRPSRNFLRLYVESAYVRTGENQVRRPGDFRREDKIRGSVLLAKKLRGEAIRRPRQR